MTWTLSVLLEITAEIHEVQGGGSWAEVPRFPGCVAQAETMEMRSRRVLPRETNPTAVSSNLAMQQEGSVASVGSHTSQPSLTLTRCCPERWLRSVNVGRSIALGC
jgi:hypothetical protein